MIIMPLPICGICGAEIVLLAVSRALGIPDPIFFLLLGALMASLGFWTHKILKTKYNINKKHQVKLIVLAYVLIAALGLYLSGAC